MEVAGGQAVEAAALETAMAAEAREMVAAALATARRGVGEAGVAAATKGLAVCVAMVTLEAASLAKEAGSAGTRVGLLAAHTAGNMKFDAR